ncbi:uroporphyrinogen-III synthase [Sphingoaurantiacus capsulatus]|uniref:Uroporphyrinogen-III synthase n=1 Tax=Sphingoaurantiacus capsulatus TaxID=1771310 RepID=A0ABV7XEB6_9SPHN
MTSPPSCSAPPARRCARFSRADPIARVLVTRPAPLAQVTAATLEAAGHDVIVAPLLSPVAREWTPPAKAPEALLFTSPQGPRFAGPKADRSLPAYVVGTRTGEAAREAGFTDVRERGGDVAGLFSAVAKAGHRLVLHLAGEDRTAAVPPPGLTVEVRSVYAAELLPLTGEAEAALRDGAIDWALLFSSRSAAHFAVSFDALGQSRAEISIAAISPTALSAAGPGWRAAVAAATPSEAGILAASGLSCDKSRGEGATRTI